MRAAPLAFRRTPYYEPDTVAPDPVPCQICNDPIDPVWVEKFSSWGWCRGNNPHPHCAAAQKREEDRQARRESAKRANVPLRNRAHHFGNMDLQGDEPDWQYMGNAVRFPTRISTLKVNAAAVQAIKDFTPGARRWLYIQGNVGTGKTLLASCLAIEQVKPAPGMFLDPDPDWLAARGLPPDARPPGSRRLVAPKRWRTLFCDWSELLRRVRLAWKGDQAPLKQVADMPLLILDDLGDPDKRLRESQLEEVEKLLTARYRDELPTVITSNVSWHEAIDHDRPYFGSRVADRLVEVCDAVTLRGPSWRNPPQAPKAKRGKVLWPDEKTKAAEPEQGDMFVGEEK